MDSLGELQGKLGSGVWLRSRTGKRVYEREWVRGPERRTEAQLRAMAALSSGTRAWRRLSDSERELWQNSPPIKTLRRKNRDARSDQATGWNWFIGAYIVESQTMVFAAAANENGVYLSGTLDFTAARVSLPANHPNHLAFRASTLLNNQQGSAPINVTATIVSRNEAGLELWRESDVFIIPAQQIRPWSTGFKHRSDGQKQAVELHLQSSDNNTFMYRCSLEVLY